MGVGDNGDDADCVFCGDGSEDLLVNFVHVGAYG